MTELQLQIERFDTPIGVQLVLSDTGNRLRAVDWEDHTGRLQQLLARQYPGQAVKCVDRVGPSDAARALRRYYDGDLSAIDGLACLTGGTRFQRAVWALLRNIPCGQTRSYGQLAADLGKPGASRAVGLANGANPIAVVVPCHRVIGADQTLTGYGGGIERKRWLLVHEGAWPNRPADPQLF